MIQNIRLLVKKNLMLLVTIVLCLLFLKFNRNLEQEFKQINNGYKDKSVINLAKGLEKDDLSNFLYTGNYVSDPTDANFIAEQIVTKLNEGKTLSNLYELNKLTFRVPVAFADSLGGEGLRERVERSFENLGYDSESIAKQKEELPDKIKTGAGTGEISVHIQPYTTVNFIKKLLRNNQKDVPNVLVQIREHYYDSLQVAQYNILGYAKTNAQGIVTFEGLDTAHYYSVLPIMEGFEYGSAKGTIGGSLGAKNKGKQNFYFTQREHTIRLFDNMTYQQIKGDDALTVRTPDDFRSELIKYLIIFFVVWWSLYFMLRWRKKSFSRGIIALLMLLTGFCLLTMFSIHNPLTDKMLGVDMAQGIIAGIAIIGVLQFVDFIKFFQDNSVIKFDFFIQFFKWFFKPFREKVKPLTAMLKNGKKNGLVKFLAQIGRAHV